MRLNIQTSCHKESRHTQVVLGYHSYMHVYDYEGGIVFESDCMYTCIILSN